MKHSAAGCCIYSILATLAIMSPSTANAVVLGLGDDFQDGSEQSWVWGRPGIGGPENLGGGQGGAGDLYLRIESFGGDDAPGSRMTFLNREQWTGDFLTAGITVIRLDAVNLGPNFAFKDLNLRLAFSSNTALLGSGRVATTESFLLTRGSGWQQLEFQLDLANGLTPLGGSNVTEVMSAVDEMRIISAALPAFIGDQFIARLGVDNIIALPEPGSLQLVIIAAAMGWRCARKRSLINSVPVYRTTTNT